ncbi:MAG: acyltransferase [Psychroflexus halocasei]
MKIYLFIKNILKLNIIKTLYLNFKMLDFKTAIKLPIYVYGKTDFRDLSGNIIIEGNVKRGMILLGRRGYVSNDNGLSTLIIRGKITLSGPINIYRGNYIFVANNAVLKIGSYGTFIGSNCKIICFDQILIGDMVQVTWECQITDTSFHYFELDSQKPLTRPVVLNDNVWIGNRVSIMKGTILLSYTTVASNSLCNKDYTNYGENILIAGMPAKLLKTNIRRLFDEKKEADLDKRFNYYRTRL